jgi:hypothetical protein
LHMQISGKLVDIVFTVIRLGEYCHKYSKQGIEKYDCQLASGD